MDGLDLGEAEIILPPIDLDRSAFSEIGSGYSIILNVVTNLPLEILLLTNEYFQSIGLLGRCFL